MESVYVEMLAATDGTLGSPLEMIFATGKDVAGSGRPLV
jgi:hypothetical protein